MSRIIALPSLKYKPTRHTPRPSAPFGAGIFTRLARFEPTDADRQWAAQAFNSSPEPDYDTLAAEAAFVDAMSDLTPVDLCRSCGQPAEVDRDGLCPDCEAYADRVATPY
jgi:hypothetical protein